MSVELVSVILPVYNQADHIATLLEDYAAGLEDTPLDYELLPVINGPRRDNSEDVCRSLESRLPSVRTLCLDEGGWGRAVRFGLSQARGDLLCYTNSARTTARDLQLAVVYGSIHPNSVIKANRKIRESAYRRFGSLLYNVECRALFDLPYWDVNGTPKVFSRDLVELLKLTRDDDLIDLEFNVVCRRENYPVIEIPILSSKRHSGPSTTSLHSAFHMYWGAWRMLKSMPPK